MTIHVSRVNMPIIISEIRISFDRDSSTKVPSAGMSLAMDKQRDIYLVIGGNGFLGRHIVQQLRDRSDIVSSFDIVERYNDIPFYPGDISDQSSVASALRQVCCSFSSMYPLQFSLPERSYMYNTHRVTTFFVQQLRITPQSQRGGDQGCHFCRSRVWGPKTRLYQLGWCNLQW